MKGHLLAYNIIDHPDNNFRLEHDPHLPIAFSAWKRASATISREPELLDCSAITLKTRWEEGMAACAVYRGEVVSYISRIPFFSAKKRGQLSKVLGISEPAFPQVDVLQSVTGWTRTDWRKKGVYTFLNERLYLSGGSAAPVHVSFCVGLAASPTFIKLGWHLADWSKLPFVTSLGGWIENGEMYVLHEDVSKATSIIPYCGNHITKRDFSKHKWDQYCHFWVQDIREIYWLERQLALLLDGNISKWRQALKQSLLSNLQSVYPFINPAAPYFILINSK